MRRSFYIAALLGLMFAHGSAHAQPKLPTKEKPAQFAIIELDAARVKSVSTAAWVEENDGARRVKFRFGSPKDLNVHAGFFDKKKLVPELVKEAAKDVARHYLTLCGDLQPAIPNKEPRVPARQIALVASCQFYDLTAKEKDDIREAITKAIDDMATDAWKARKDRPTIDVRFLSPKEEFEFTSYSLREYVLDRWSEDVTEYSVVDVGHAPLKAGYFEPNSGFQLSKFQSIPLLPGAIQLTASVKAGLIEEKVIKEGEDYYPKFAGFLPKTVDDVIGKSLTTQAATKPSLRNLDIQYVIGDASWALSVFIKPEALLNSNERMEVTSAEVAAFAKLVVDSRNADGSLKFPNFEPPAEFNTDQRLLLKAHYDRVRGSFTPEQLASAAVILKSVSEKFQFGNTGKKVYILKDSRHVWMSGYLQVMIEASLLPESK